MKHAFQIIAAALCLLLIACAPPSFRRNPVPESQVDYAVPVGMPEEVRRWGDVDVPNEQIALFTERYRQFDMGSDQVNWLVLSGGGQNGAFGAGLLVGWTDSGERPVFDAVTGVSTGALIAPFALLGPEYDEALEEAYTAYSTSDLVRRRGLLTALQSDAMANTTGLRRMIERYVDQEMVDEIERIYNEEGRTVSVATTNLDTMRPVVWRLSAMAASGHPDRVKMIQTVLLASAAIPAAFPPVFIEVDVRGRRFDEMHVDGGTTTQLFAYPLAMDMREFLDAIGIRESPDLYVIRNAQITAQWEAVKPRLANIAGRAIKSLIRTQGIGDVYQIFVATVRDDIDFYLASIPEDFDIEPQEDFDPVYMRALFDLGRDMAAAGYPWERYPPNFDPETLRNRD